ncbi:MAG: NUDIX hydrolase, partial [Planctomycetota bacterium]
VHPVRRIWSSVTPVGIQLGWWLTQLRDGQEPVANPEEVERCFWITAPQLHTLENPLGSMEAFMAAWAAGEFKMPMRFPALPR